MAGDEEGLRSSPCDRRDLSHCSRRPVLPLTTSLRAPRVHGVAVCPRPRLTASPTHQVRPRQPPWDGCARLPPGVRRVPARWSHGQSHCLVRPARTSTAHCTARFTLSRSQLARLPGSSQSSLLQELESVCGTRGGSGRGLYLAQGNVFLHFRQALLPSAPHSPPGAPVTHLVLPPPPPQELYLFPCDLPVAKRLQRRPPVPALHRQTAGRSCFHCRKPMVPASSEALSLIISSVAVLSCGSVSWGRGWGS